MNKHEWRGVRFPGNACLWVKHNYKWCPADSPFVNEPTSSIPIRLTVKVS